MRNITLLLLLLLNFILYGQLPDSPILDTVSVEPINIKGNVYVSWSEVTDQDIEGYIIYRDLKTSLDAPNWATLDTIFGASNTFYEDVTSNADGEYEFYIMRSFNNTNKSLLSQPFSTIYTFPYIETENCKNMIRVHWDYHNKWEVTFGHFDIYCSKDYGPYEKIGTSNGVERNYKFFNLEDQTSYSFYVRGILANTKEVTSNSVRTFTNFPSVTKYLNADYATVQNELIKMQFTLDNSGDIKNYQIVRSDSLNGIYESIYAVNNYLPVNLNYIDLDADARRSYFYKIQAIDLCGNAYIESNIAQNITLDISTDRIITWNNYNLWLGGVSKYELYRTVNNNNNTKTLIYTTYNEVNIYNDYIFLQNATSSINSICYDVVAYEGYNNPYSIMGESKSFKKCINKTEIKKITNKKTFSITPNPASNNAQIIINNKQLIGSSIQIINSNGAFIKEYIINNDKLLIDISDLDNGMYIVKVMDTETVTTQKLIVN